MKNVNHQHFNSLSYSESKSNSSFFRFEKRKGVCVISEGEKNKGLYSAEWAQYICKKMPLEALKSKKGIEYFLDHIWEPFYEEKNKKIKDPFYRHKFEKEGSYCSLTACWLKNKEDKVLFRCLSYGNSAVLVYNKKTEELFVPEYGDSIIGFLNNKGLINWKDESLREKYLIVDEEQELTKNTMVILANNTMAEHLVISYLIIKSKGDDYWEKLSEIMQTNDNLSKLIFNNRTNYEFDSFLDVLKKWESEAQKNNINSFAEDLVRQKRIARNDLTLHVFGYDQNAPELITFHKPATILPIEQPPNTVKVIVPKPQKKKTPKFKANKNAFIDVILDNKITKLYHFTDRLNLESIKKLGGLYSWNYLLNNRINIPLAGGDQVSRMLDSRYGLENFVRVSFCSQHPMMFVALNERRIQDPVILEIDPNVILFYETLFSNMNATKNNHHRGGDIADLLEVKFDICLKNNYLDVDDEDKPFFQAEVMVKEFIPAQYILNINNF